MTRRTLRGYGKRESAIPSHSAIVDDSVAFSPFGLARYHRHRSLNCYGMSTSRLVTPFPSLDQRNSWPSSLPLTVEKDTNMMTPAPRFANEDEAAQHWLLLLREGDATQKIQARERLAAIFECRGMYEEATDLLVSNARAGVRNADIFRWLARLYRAQGDEVTAMQAAAEAAKFMPSSPSPHSTPILSGQEMAPSPDDVAATADGACLECGYVNRRRRSMCKRCKTPMSRGVWSDGASGDAQKPKTRRSLGRQFLMWPVVFGVVVFAYTMLAIIGILGAMFIAPASWKPETVGAVVAWFGGLLLANYAAERIGRPRLYGWLVVPFGLLAIIYAWQRAGLVGWVQVKSRSQDL
jgi:hypothetical protein